MKKLKPLNDFVFQKLMGEKGSEEELRSFLSAVLARNLVSVEILENTILTAEVISDKKSILDVRATADDGTHINIEVQLKDYGNMDKRTLFYWSKMFSTAIDKGDDYIKLPDVVTINILSFDFIGLDKFHTIFHLWEDTERYKLTNAVEIHFIEMKKFTALKEKDIENNILHRWLTFFDENVREETLKELIEMDKTIGKANEKLKFLATNKDILHYAHLREMAASDYNSGMNHARREGERIGLEKGKIEIARNLLKEKLPLEIIVKSTGLDIATIEEIVKDTK